MQQTSSNGLNKLSTLQILLNRLGKKQDLNEELLILSDVQRAYGKAQPGQMLGSGSPLEEAFPGKLGKHT